MVLDSRREGELFRQIYLLNWTISSLKRNLFISTPLTIHSSISFMECLQSSDFDDLSLSTFVIRREALFLVFLILMVLHISESRRPHHRFLRWIILCVRILHSINSIINAICFGVGFTLLFFFFLFDFLEIILMVLRVSKINHFPYPS